MDNMKDGPKQLNNHKRQRIQLSISIQFNSSLVCVVKVHVPHFILPICRNTLASIFIGLNVAIIASNITCLVESL